MRQARHRYGMPGRHEVRATTNFRALLCASPGVMPAQHTQPTFCLQSLRLPDLSLPLAFVSPLRRRQTVLRMVMHTWRTDTVLHAHLGNLVGRR